MVVLEALAQEGRVQAARPAALASREIVVADLPAIAALLSEGFPDRALAWFEAVLARMSRLPEVLGLPRFGYVLVAGGQPVGVVLTFVAQHKHGYADRCLNVSCWYVRPRYRAYGTILYQRLLAIGDITLLNVTPAIHTWPVIEAQGFRRFAEGTFIGLPAFSRQARTVRLLPLSDALKSMLPLPELRLLEIHAAEGCFCFACITPAGVFPFVFRRRPLRRIPLAAQLIYCRDLADLEQCGGAIGMHLLRHGFVVMLVAADGPLPGIPGRFLHSFRPMYYKGPSKPRLGDLAYTEIAFLPS